MRPFTIPLALMALFTGAMSAPANAEFPRALSAREAPCDAWSEECYEVITANACFAAYITGTNVTRILNCVDVNDHTVAERRVGHFFSPQDFYATVGDSGCELVFWGPCLPLFLTQICNCYGCSETTVQNWAVKTLGCPA
ncbi:hypothetical protein QBC37DRAFT_393494 [Rhypophila decipiens]|uniref:Uncharacterized protein n=1 Tax=Rhypophila decipiens TaxID=261697 RepID=A0AAN7B126_9PEZI|nr:hypothetical protein QBC37DRAFT_393494 [Rhypophila decipiens]